MTLSDEDRLRIETAQATARRLGYVLFVDEAHNVPAPITHMVYSHPDIQQASMGTFLCYSSSAANAAEAGVEIIRGVVERGQPWPEQR